MAQKNDQNDQNRLAGGRPQKWPKKEPNWLRTREFTNYPIPLAFWPQNGPFLGHFGAILLQNWPKIDPNFGQQRGSPKNTKWAYGLNFIPPSCRVFFTFWPPFYQKECTVSRKILDLEKWIPLTDFQKHTPPYSFGLRSFAYQLFSKPEKVICPYSFDLRSFVYQLFSILTKKVITRTVLTSGALCINFLTP